MITKTEAWEWWVASYRNVWLQMMRGATRNPPSPMATHAPDRHDWSTPTPEQIDPDLRQRFEREWAICERQTCIDCKVAADPNAAGFAAWMNPGGICPKHGKKST